MIQAVINDPEELVIAITVEANYNPDILDDVKRRVLDAYKEAVAFRMAIAPEPAEASEE